MSQKDQRPYDITDMQTVKWQTEREGGRREGHRERPREKTGDKERGTVGERGRKGGKETPTEAGREGAREKGTYKKLTWYYEIT